MLHAVLGVEVGADALEHARASGRLLTSGQHRAFSPSDACADNNLVTSKGLRVLDFEGGCVRDVALDAAALRIPFPLCGCSFRLPNGMTEAMIAAWRAEVSPVFPDLDDDEVLMPKCWPPSSCGCGCRPGCTCRGRACRTARSRAGCRRRGAAARCTPGGSGWVRTPAGWASRRLPSTPTRWRPRSPSGSGPRPCHLPLFPAFS